MSSYQQGGSAGEDVPMDQVSLNFSKIQVAYTPQRGDGAPGDAVSGGWDLKGNVKI